MDRDPATEPTIGQALALLRAHADGLRAKGVLHAAVFGSVARGSAGPDSDVDVLVELDYARGLSLFDFARICEDIGDLFDGRADVVSKGGLKPRYRDSISADAVYAF
jgi:hypothetical protein